MIVQPALALARRPLLSFVAAVAVAETLSEVTSLDARLKWPNDVLVGGRKIAGILLEARGGDTVVIGIGVNVMQSRFPAELSGLATSVLRETGRGVDRDLLLDTLIRRFDVWRQQLEGHGFEPLRARWTTLAHGIGAEVRVGSRTGIALGLDEDGALLLRDEFGTHRVVAGTVETGLAGGN